MTTAAPRWELEVRRLHAELLEAGWVAGVCVGMPVETTGLGCTQRWRGFAGRVRSFDGDRVRVSFQSMPEQTLDMHEIRPRVRHGCPCARCTWEMEHHR